MRKKTLRSTLTTFSAAIILGIILLFSTISCIYLLYISEIIQKIYSMDDDFISPIINILLILLVLLIIFALCASFISSLSISNRFLKTIQHFIQDIRCIKQEGMDHRLKIEGNDELAALGNEFNMLMDQVEDTMQKQNQFISDASHELKTPLAILKGNLDMLNRWGKEDQEVLENALQVSSKEVERLLALCEELLHLTREEEYHGEEIMLAEVIQQTCDEMKAMYPTFTIQSDLDDSIACMKAEHLKQLCIIFLDNAIKYTKEDVHKIEVSLFQNSLQFKDYGMGIQEEHLQTIFDRFYKVEQSREQQANSFGLGLSIAKRICDRYGFEIEVVSEYQQYTIFTIRFNKKEQEG